MTFGADYGEVVGHEACPRCKAPAVTRSRKRESSTLFENHLTCPKCHYVTFVGVATFERMLTEKRLNRFKRLREKARTPREQRRLDQRIAEVQKQMDLHDVIKWPKRRKQIEPIPADEAWSEKDSTADGEESSSDQTPTIAQEDSGRGQA